MVAARQTIVVKKVVPLRFGLRKTIPREAESWIKRKIETRINSVQGDRDAGARIAAIEIDGVTRHFLVHVGKAGIGAVVEGSYKGTRLGYTVLGDKRNAEHTHFFEILPFNQRPDPETLFDALKAFAASDPELSPLVRGTTANKVLEVKKFLRDARRKK